MKDETLCYPKDIRVEPHGDGYVLLVDDGQAGLFGTQKGAKASARRFVHSTDRIKWVTFGNGIKAEKR